MCWSAEVSTVFSALDIAAMTILILRNKKTDRLFALAMTPIVCQEICQIILWKNIGVNFSECNTINAQISLFIRLIIIFEPLTCTLLAIYGSEKIPRISLKFVKPMLAFVCFYVVSYILLSVYGFKCTGQQCTYPGPNGHQIWIDYLETSGKFIDLFYAAPYVLIPVTSFALFFRPFWKAFALILCVFTFFPIRLLYPIEYASIWCWSGSFFFLFGLLEPYVIKKRNTQPPTFP